MSTLSESKEIHVRDDVLKRLNDPSLLHTESYIGGSWVNAADDDRVEVHDPASGEVLARVTHAKAVETKAAIAEASSVFGMWSAKSGLERSNILRRWFELLRENQDDIATLMVLESGKPLAQAKAEITSGLGSVEWFAEEAKRVDGDILCSPFPNKRYLVMRQAIGVVGAITPWNFPFSMITRKISPALAAGCTVVLKPSELTPLTALAMAELGERAGIPLGVLNVVVGDAKSIGDELIKSDEVRKIAFTGSTRIGKILMAGAASTVKEDLKAAASQAAASSHRNAGQTCICTNRVLVHESVHDEFVKELVAAVQEFRLGHGTDPSTTHGPLIQPGAVDKVEEKVQDALLKGATVQTGGKRPTFSENSPLNNGFFFEPTVISNATIDMKVFREEIFGPVTPVFKFSSDEEAVKLANNTEYGLAAYLFTKDLARAWKVSEALEFGMVGVNDVLITSYVSPFGGVKQSGLGREESKYLQMKSVCMNLGY
ncbi:hypothetical protein QBZ16_002253 [Prototheca wickerhamii]|uniref:Aldehyde dehydrogenase family 5 member F1 n=1 Tax=Prototheca wickerhamii TaxID=3111 RepID=A0AAD9ILL9_PROWI|nr:hypothetical protein QBZ16_002253 [Prototheca wickerhamii]